MRNWHKTIISLCSAYVITMLVMGCAGNTAQGKGGITGSPAADSAQAGSTSAATASVPDQAVTETADAFVVQNNGSGITQTLNGSDSGIAKLLYQGHASFRITTAEGKVIYMDPYAGVGYNLPADLILVTHEHNDHNNLSLIQSRNPGCRIITEKEALKGGDNC